MTIIITKYGPTIEYYKTWNNPKLLKVIRDLAKYIKFLEEEKEYLINCAAEDKAELSGYIDSLHKILNKPKITGRKPNAN